MSKTKNFGRNFLIGIDPEWFKTYFEMKISISKKFSHYDNLRGTLPFFLKMGIIYRKNGNNKNFWSKFSFDRNRCSMVQTYFKTKISISKIVSHYDSSLGTYLFSKNGCHSSNHPLESKDPTRL